MSNQYIKKDLQLFQEVTVDGKTESVEVPVFDFVDLNFDEIANNAQERLLNLIVKRQKINIELEEIMQCFTIPFTKALNGRV
jgi:hypothetical protein